MDMQVIIVICWGVGITGYTILKKFTSYNTLNYFNVRNKVKKYKSIEHSMSESVSKQNKFF